MGNEKLIDKNALIEWLKRAGRFLKGTENSKAVTHVIGKIIDHVNEMPAVEVVHGWWDACEDYHYICATEFTCSNCKETFCNSEMDDKEYLAMMKYCPNCGAKMDGDGNG